MAGATPPFCIMNFLEQQPEWMVEIMEPKANGNKPNETSLADKLVPEKPKVSKPKTLKSKPKSLIKPEDQKKRVVRGRIEDYLLAKELGIAFSSLKNTDDN